jgi:hypothetical protein
MYQSLSSKLHFNATNFQHYVKAQQGTNFILLHFWFHTLIILLHQPTLLHSFEGRIQQLFPDSRELSMSSAKTIADIIAFAELIDVKSIVGNPFTSQPMYIAARAFLAEAVVHAPQPASRCTSPPTQEGNEPTKERHEINGWPKANKSGKSSLLHSAANTNYQRCYNALKVLESYWAGCRYILTALDQMSEGLMDPLLFTAEDVDEMPSTAPSFTTPGWRRSISQRASMGAPAESPRVHSWQGTKEAGNQDSWSPGTYLSQAIGWSMTGTANSPAPNVSFLYQNRDSDPISKDTSAAKITPTGPAAQHSERAPDRWDTRRLQGHDKTMLPPILPTDTPSTDADLLLNMSSEHVPNNFSHVLQQIQSQPFPHSHASHPQTYIFNDSPNFADLPLISHDLDMSISNNTFAFPGAEDVIPWLEYLPQDVLNYFGEPQGNGSGPELPGV